MIRALLVVLSLCTFANHAAAQNDDSARARALFERATAAMAEGRVAQARELFRESLSLEPRPATAFNLAVTLREAGAFTEAIATYEALLAGEYGTLEESQRREVQRTVVEVRRSLGRLILTVEGADRVILRVDGRAVETVNDGARVEVMVDPGEHVVTAQAPRAEPAERQVVVESGRSAPVEFDVAPADDEAPLEDEEDDGRLFASPWPWIIFGVIALGGVAVALVVTLGNESPEPQPLPDDLVLGRVTTLSF